MLIENEYCNPILYDVIVSDVNSPFENQRRERIKHILLYNLHLAALCEKDCFERDSRLVHKIIKKAKLAIERNKPLQATLALLEYKEFSLLANILKLDKKYQGIFKRETQINERIYNILIHCSAFSYEESLVLFEKLQTTFPFNPAIENSRKNYLITYNSLMSKGDYQQGIQLFQEMKEQGLQPNIVTYNSLMSKGDYQQGIQLFQEMKEQ